MRIFVFEYVTAHGIGRDPASPEHSLHREGRAMRDALVADLTRIPDVAVVPFADGAPPPDDWVPEAVARSDRQLVVAPEFDGILADLARRLEACGGRSLGPTADAIGLTADKLLLAEHWRGRGVRTPATTDRAPTECEAFPVVWKPRDGAGSTAAFRLDRPADVARCAAVRVAEGHAGKMVLQEHVAGLPASVAFLTGPGACVPLVPALQDISGDGRLKYRGGSAPLPADLAGRAVRLGLRALEGIDGLRGWVGVDLVLGDAADGSRDYAIEVNPRLTTSYVGLRALAAGNLAAAMLAAAEGTAPQIVWKPGGARFAADGTVAVDPP